MPPPPPPTITTRAAVLLHGRQHYWHKFVVKGTNLDSVTSIAVVPGSSTHTYQLDFELTDDTASGHIAHVLTVIIKRVGAWSGPGGARANPGDSDNLQYTVTNGGGTSPAATVDIVNS